MQLCGSLSILWHCLSLGLECKLTFSSSVATAEFSKFAGILSAAPSQHHLSGFEIAQLEFHHLHLLCFCMEDYNYNARLNTTLNSSHSRNMLHCHITEIIFPIPLLSYQIIFLSSFILINFLIY